MFRLPRNPRLWLGSFALWLGVLWVLSASHPTLPNAPGIPHFDKLCHAGYFFGGGGLLSAFLYCRTPGTPNWRSLITLAVICLALLAWLDEYHQTFTPGRSGNDCWDWLADVLGALAGALVFKRLRYLIRDA